MAGYVIRVSHGGSRIEDLSFDEPSVVVGRDVTGLRLEDGNVSSTHGRLDFDGKQLRFTDAGSTNGTRGPDGQPLTAALLMEPGMTIGLANSTITLMSVEAEPAGSAGALSDLLGDAAEVPAPILAATEGEPRWRGMLSRFSARLGL